MFEIMVVIEDVFDNDALSDVQSVCLVAFSFLLCPQEKSGTLYNNFFRGWSSGKSV